MREPLCILTVHAHPDDESSKGAGSIAKYHAEGIHTVLVCCTGGEAGDILNPAMDKPEVRDNLPAVRKRELERAASIIGYDEVVMLGYKDSGMHEKMEELGIESPWKERMERMKDWPNQDDRTTTSVDIADYDDVRRNALLAHETQVDPNSGFWFSLPPEVARTVHPYDDYILAESLVDTELPEDDLFAGVRDLVRH